MSSIYDRRMTYVSSVGRRSWFGLLVVVLCCQHAPAVPAATQQQPAPDSWHGLLYIKDERPRKDLWVQSLDGSRHQQLTDSGRVAAWPRPGLEGPFNGAVISPDGRRVAYAERHPVVAGKVQLPEHAPDLRGHWELLFVMNADGTGRRKLVDLREVPLPEGQTRSGSFVWSSDGTRLAYALETFKPGCSHLTLHVVEVTSGQVTPVLTGKPLGQVQLLTWSSPRDELTFTSVCDEKAGTPEGGRLLGTLHLPTGIMRTRPAWNPVVSTDGTQAFISGEPVPRQRPTLVRVDETFTVEHLLKAPLWGHLVWYHQRPAGLFTAKTPERPQLECQGMTPLPQSFYRLEAGTQTLSLLRQEATALRVVDFSPDDTQALVYILIGRDESSWGVCGAAWSQRLYLVRRDELESELPVHELLAHGIALAPASLWPGPTNTLFIGWLR